jgi:hypothetical protein
MDSGLTGITVREARSFANVNSKNSVRDHRDGAPGWMQKTRFPQGQIGGASSFGLVD